ncbi:MAG: YncE family protein [Ginsengibacter sp.]
MLLKFMAAGAFCFSIFTHASCQDKDDQKVRKVYHIESGGGWDYIAVNHNKLYVSHGTQVNILDEKTGDSTGVIPNTTGVHGIAFNNELKRGYTSNGRLNNVTVFDLSTNNIITQVATGENPDAIVFEPFLKNIVTCNGRGKSLSFIDPTTNTVTHTVALEGKPEEAASDGQGKYYVNIEDKNEIAVIDLKTFTVLHYWPLSPGEGPTGLAFDVQNKRLFSGCEKLLIVTDATNGKNVARLPIGDGCDGVAFDQKENMIYTSNGDGTITAIKQKNNNEYKVKATIPTKKSARTIAIDEKTHELFLPAAELEPVDPADKNARRKMIPGTFQILVVH